MLLKPSFRTLNLVMGSSPKKLPALMNPIVHCWSAGILAGKIKCAHILVGIPFWGRQGCRAPTKGRVRNGGQNTGR